MAFGRALVGAVVALVALGGVLALAPRPVPDAARGSAAAPERELVVFAAASLADAFGELAPLFESEHPGARVVFNHGSSAGLRVQLEQGAPGDVYAAADAAQMALAERGGLIAGERQRETPRERQREPRGAPQGERQREPQGEPQVFARNELAIITPRDKTGRVETPRDLARPGLRLVTTGPQVPIGAYTRQMLDALAADADYGADFATRVLANVRSEEDNVRAVVAKVLLGEADAGVVYASDVTPRVAPEVRTVPVPAEFNVSAAYPIAVLRDARQPELAERWVALVRSEAGQAALARWGFLPADR